MNQEIVMSPTFLQSLATVWIGDPAKCLETLSHLLKETLVIDALDIMKSEYEREVCECPTPLKSFFPEMLLPLIQKPVKRLDVQLRPRQRAEYPSLSHELELACRISYGIILAQCDDGFKKITEYKHGVEIADINGYVDPDENSKISKKRSIIADYEKFPGQYFNEDCIAPFVKGAKHVRIDDPYMWREENISHLRRIIKKYFVSLEEIVLVTVEPSPSNRDYGTESAIQWITERKMELQAFLDELPGRGEIKYVKKKERMDRQIATDQSWLVCGHYIGAVLPDGKVKSQFNLIISSRKLMVANNTILSRSKN